MLVRLFVLGVFLLFSVSLLFVSFETKENYLRIDVLDVGQGDAILITAPSGNQMLIDAGKDTSVLRALGEVMDYADREIDIVVATHPDADHIGGFPRVFERYDISNIVGANAYSETDIFREYTEAAEQEALFFSAERGQVIDMGSGVHAQVLFPYADVTITGNEASVILQVFYGDIKILLTGDAGKGVEEHLVSVDGRLLSSDVLKVGHHRSKTSTSELFLEVVQPIVSLISAGKDNRYGHPHPDVLRTLTGAGIPTLGTYEDGTITLFSDGTRVWRK